MSERSKSSSRSPRQNTSPKATGISDSKLNQNNRKKSIVKRETISVEEFRKQRQEIRDQMGREFRQKSRLLMSAKSQDGSQRQSLPRKPQILERMKSKSTLTSLREMVTMQKSPTSSHQHSSRRFKSLKEHYYAPMTDEEIKTMKQNDSKHRLQESRRNDLVFGKQVNLNMKIDMNDVKLGDDKINEEYQIEKCYLITRRNILENGLLVEEIKRNVVITKIHVTELVSRRYIQPSDQKEMIPIESSISKITELPEVSQPSIKEPSRMPPTVSSSFVGLREPTDVLGDPSGTGRESSIQLLREPHQIESIPKIPEQDSDILRRESSDLQPKSLPLKQIIRDRSMPPETSLRETSIEAPSSLKPIIDRSSETLIRDLPSREPRSRESIQPLFEIEPTSLQREPSQQDLKTFESRPKGKNGNFNFLKNNRAFSICFILQWNNLKKHHYLIQHQNCKENRVQRKI